MVWEYSLRPSTMPASSLAEVGKGKMRDPAFFSTWSPVSYSCLGYTVTLEETWHSVTRRISRKYKDDWLPTAHYSWKIKKKKKPSKWWKIQLLHLHLEMSIKPQIQMMAAHQICHLGRLYISSDAVIDQDISEMLLLKLFSLLWRRKKFSVLLLYNYILVLIQHWKHLVWSRKSLS